MRNSIPQAESRRRQHSVGTSSVSNAAVALVPVLACFLGGATEKWAEGIVVGFLGFFLVVRPPRLSLGPATNGILAALLLLAAIAFLPDRWFFIPAWRVALVNDFGISLVPTVSPQPWLTAPLFFHWNRNPGGHQHPVLLDASQSAVLA